MEVRYPIRAKDDLLPLRKLHMPEAVTRLMDDLGRQGCSMSEQEATEQIVNRQLRLEHTITLHSKTAAKNGGDYDFDMQGQSMIVSFVERDGKLFGAPPGETPEEILPVKGDNPLKFEVTVASSGQYFELEFGRNENKEIARCILKVQGMEVVGIKRAK